MPVSWIRYKRLIAYFLDPFTLTISAQSVILELKEIFNYIIALYIVYRKVISLIYENIYFGDRVPLKGNSSAKLHSKPDSG